MKNFKERLYGNELQEIEQEMELAGYSNNFIFYVSNHFKSFFENAYVESTTALRQLKYYSAIGTLTYSDYTSKSDLLEQYEDINIFFKNNSEYKKYGYLFFVNV